MCHVKGAPQNLYGQQLNKWIPGDAKKRLEAAAKVGDAEKESEQAMLIMELQAAFLKVERLHTNPQDTGSPTWGERLRAHLPPIDPANNKPQAEE